MPASQAPHASALPETRYTETLTSTLDEVKQSSDVCRLLPEFTELQTHLSDVNERMSH